MHKRIVIPKEILYELYYNQKLSIAKIEKLLSLDDNIIKRNMKEYNFIARRYLTKSIKKECAYCKKIFYVSPRTVKRNEGKFCSKECHNNSGRIIKKCKTCGKEFTIIKSRLIKR